MAIDLADLVPSLEREVNPPGTDLFPAADDDDWVGQLSDSFWEAKLFGFFDNYSESDGLVSPISPETDDLARELQQLIVLFAGIRTIRMKLINTNTGFRAQAGPVEFETAQSSNLLKEVLIELQKKVDYILSTLGDLGAQQTYYINAVAARSDSLGVGDEAWWG